MKKQKNVNYSETTIRRKRYRQEEEIELGKVVKTFTNIISSRIKESLKGNERNEAFKRNK